MYPSGLYSYKHMIEYMCVHMSTYIICYFIPFFAETSGIKIDTGAWDVIGVMEYYISCSP